MRPRIGHGDPKTAEIRMAHRRIHSFMICF
jgi:hypothetical protein